MPLFKNGGTLWAKGGALSTSADCCCEEIVLDCEALAACLPGFLDEVEITYNFSGGPDGCCGDLNGPFLVNVTFVSNPTFCGFNCNPTNPSACPGTFGDNELFLVGAMRIGFNPTTGAAVNDVQITEFGSSYDAYYDNGNPAAVFDLCNLGGIVTLTKFAEDGTYTGDCAITTTVTITWP